MQNCVENVYVTNNEVGLVCDKRYEQLHIFTVKSPGPTLSPLPKDRRKGLVRRPKGVPRGRPQTRTDNTVRSTARVRTQGRKMGADSKDRRYGRCEEK